MKGWITLRRSVAAAKLTAAAGATYYFQRGGGERYERPVDVQTLVASFSGNPKARCWVRLSDSQHSVVIDDSRALRTGYLVHF